MTAADEISSQDHPTRALEIERKYDADDDVVAPDWTAVDVIASVDAPEPRTLDAVYLDTVDLALARAGYALRRRTGGPDAGWHVKGPLEEGGRVEVGWPLGEPDEDVPEAVRAEIATVTDAALTPLARIENARVAYALRDASGGLVAEFVDDRVRATDLRAGDVRQWREWEIELGPAGPPDAREQAAFFDAVDDAVRAAGARVAASASKLARALGH